MWIYSINIRENLFFLKMNKKCLIYEVIYNKNI